METMLKSITLGIADWFHEVIPKEGIPLKVIDEDLIKISPEGKTCIIRAQGREFRASRRF